VAISAIYLLNKIYFFVVYIFCLGNFSFVLILLNSPTGMSLWYVHMYYVHGIPEKCAFIGTLQLNTQQTRNTQQANPYTDPHNLSAMCVCLI